MAVVRKKQDDKYLKALRELITTGAGNRQCFDCGQKGPTYVNMTIGSFVCTRCSGVLRGLTPPHRVKSISMATFTQEELDFLKAHGNDMCAKTWLGLWDPKRAIHQDHRELMIDKYERKRYYLEPASPLKSLASIHNQNGYHNNSSSTNSSSTAASQNQSNNNVHEQTQQHKIHLTPPTSQRTTANGLHKSSASANSTSTTAISRPQHHHHHHHHSQQQQQTHQQDAFMMNNGGGLNGLNGLVITTNGMKPASSISSTSTGALSDTSSCASNGFGADADFVADFGSANIYDATTGGSPNVSVASSNGYAKIQPLKMQQQQQQALSSSPNVSETLSNGYAKMNGFHYIANNNNVTDNFADFDHAPIYNAADSFQFVRRKNVPKQRQGKPTVQSANTTTTNLANIFDLLNVTEDEERLQPANTRYLSHNSNYQNRSNNINNNSRRTEIIYSESTSNFNDDAAVFAAHAHDPFGDDDDVVTDVDFDSIIKRASKPQKIVRFEESEFGMPRAAATATAQQQQHKFTPLAMAAHATAMAVLGSNSHATTERQRQLHHLSANHFNNSYNYNGQRYNGHNDEGNSHHAPMVNRRVYADEELRPQLPSDSQWRHSWRENELAKYETSPVRATIARRLSNPYFQPHTFWNNSDDRNVVTTVAAAKTPQYYPAEPAEHADMAQPNLYNNNNDGYNTLADCYSNESPAATTSHTAATWSNGMMTLPSVKNPQNNQNVVSAVDVVKTLSYSPSNPFLAHLQYMDSDNANTPNNDSIFFAAMPLSHSHSCSNLNLNFSRNLCKVDADDEPVGIFARSSKFFDVQSSDDEEGGDAVAAAGDDDDVVNAIGSTCTINTSNPFLNPSITSLFCNSSSSTCSTYSTTTPTTINTTTATTTTSVTTTTSSSFLANRLPLTNGQSKGSNNNNNNNNNTPAEDRYAALKDLDEQLRESKAIAEAAATIVSSAVVDSFANNNNNNSNNANNHVNPFKSQQLAAAAAAAGANGLLVNPFQAQQQQQNTQTNLFGQMTVIPNGYGAGTHTMPLQQQQQQTPPQGFYNYSNGYGTVQGAGNSNAMYSALAASTNVPPTSNIMLGGGGVPNGCGFGFGAMQQHQLAATAGGGVGGCFNNPFAATGSLNSNNPFL